jgi:Nuclease-related domain
MASARPWPFDDEDRPSGSVRPLSQADLQAILAHLGDDPDQQLLAGTIGDRPEVAVRVRPSVGQAGGSAHAQWRRLRTAEWTAWTRTLPWRAAATLGIGAAGGLLGRLLAAPRLSLVIGLLAAMATAWGLRFKPSPDAVAWRQGAAGERRTARLLAPLERQGWAILHDLAVPGSAANLDHLVIGPGGVFVIDSKQYRGRLQLDAVWEAVAWPPSPRPYPGSGVVGGRPGRPRPARPRGGRGADRGRPWRPGPLGQGGHRRGAGGGGPAPAKHASRPSGGAGTRVGRLAGRPGPGQLPRRRLTCSPRRVPK